MAYFFTHVSSNLLPMKKNFNIFLLAVCLVALQACGGKKENKEETLAVESSDATMVAPKLTPEERRAKIEKDKAERAEKRRLSREETYKTSPTFKDENGNIVYNMSEVEPTFNGGTQSLEKYLKDNLIYPKEAQDNQLEGTVFVDFVVAKDGMVRGVTVTDEGDVDQSLRMEAIRVVSTMPKWVAGKQQGKAVDVKYSLPITFQLF